MKVQKKKKPNVTMSEDGYYRAVDGSCGLCLACGEIEDGGVEPDASGYICTLCGEPAVEGIENALVLGFIDMGES